MSQQKTIAFMHRIFPLLEQASTWKSFYAALLRFSAVASGFVASVFCIHNFRKMPNLSYWGDAAVVTFNIGICLTAYMVIHLFWHRSNSIKYLEEESYPILRIFSHITRLTGELVATLCFGIGVFTGLAICVAGHEAMHVTYGIGFYEVGASAWLWGAATMITGMGYGVLSLLLGRLSFEGMVLMIDVSNNIRKIKVFMQTKGVMISTQQQEHKSHHKKEAA